MLNRRLTLIVALWLVSIAAALPAQTPAPGSAAGTAPGATPPGALSRALSDTPWQDRAWGISVRLPVGVILKSETADGQHLFRAADPQGLFQLSLQVKRSGKMLKIEDVAKVAREQIQTLQGAAQVLEERAEPLMKRPAVVIHASVPEGGTEQVLLSQAIVQIDAQTFAVLEGRCKIANAQEVLPIFEAVIDTLDMTDLNAIEKQRQAALQAGREWRMGIKLSEIESALVPEQWFRLLRDNKDIGFMNMRQRRAQREGLHGVGIEIQARIFQADRTVDVLEEYFLSDDDRQEFWKITTTARPADADHLPPSNPLPVGKNITYVETGIRTDGEILVTFDSNEGNWRSKKEQMQRPAVGYLSQVERILLPQLLPIDHPATYGFYCYHRGAGKVMYRTEQVTPALTGFTLTTRQAPNDPEIRAAYTAQRRLVEQTLSATDKMMPATPKDIQTRWINR